MPALNLRKKKIKPSVFINDELVDFLKTKVREIADRFNVEVVSMECDKDHFHMLFKELRF